MIRILLFFALCAALIVGGGGDAKPSLAAEPLAPLGSPGAGPVIGQAAAAALQKLGSGKSEKDRLVGLATFPWYDSRGNQSHIHRPSDPNQTWLSVRSHRWTRSPRGSNYSARVGQRPPEMGASFHMENRDFWTNTIQQAKLAGANYLAYSWPHIEAENPLNITRQHRALAHVNAVLSSHRGAVQSALFFNTPYFAGRNISRPRIREHFYNFIRDFFSRLDAANWLRIDGRPVVIMYNDDKLRGKTRTSVPFLKYLRSSFKRDFGVGLYFVTSRAWRTWAGRPERLYVWGASQSPDRFRVYSGTDVRPLARVATVSPGYRTWKGKTSGTPPSLSRFNRGLRLARKSGARMLLVDSLNEFHESTAVIPTIEYGTSFRDALYAHAQLFYMGL